MALLFLVLIIVVRQGERIIEARARERLRLEEKLRRSEHLSAIGEMTAGVSHEIRNPLGIIKSSAELLKKKMKKLDQPTNIIDIIVEESIRLNNIIRDFLDFAKPMTPALKPCDADSLIDKLIHHLSGQAKENGITMEKTVSPDLPEIMGDSERLHQAFLNIALNALQAMTGPGGTLIISVFTRFPERINRLPQDTVLSPESPASFPESTARYPEEIALSPEKRREVVFMFRDSGPGIPEETLKKIWNPFFTTKDTGTGLGLGIVKNIIESHQGEVEIFNSNKGGATVRIVLPAM
ncbi:MAG: hypothetical protein HQK66_14875 [Desulfamplus sp.]|nr:hypothetical protein [Desulfamplus sp.]